MIITITFFQDNVTTSTSYSYDANLQLKKTESSTNSDNKSYSPMMYYATDLGNTMLTQKNMVGIPLKVENKVNGVVKKITVVDYDFFNSTQVLPKYIKEYNRDNTTFTTRLDVLSYNGSGLPLSAIINNALVPETYAWSATMLLLSKTFGGLTWSYTYKLNSRLTESVIRLCWVCLRFQQILNQKTGMLVRVSVTPYRVLKRSAI